MVTAGTSSPLTDGAAAVLVTSDAFAAKHGLQALARIKSFATVRVDPAVMGIGPIPATRNAWRDQHRHRAGACLRSSF